MDRFEENKIIKRVEYPQLRETTSDVIAIQLGLQPTFFMKNEERSALPFFSRFRKKK